MKSLLVTALLSALALPSPAETVKITIEHGKSSREYLVATGESRVFDNIKKREFPATAGDCSGYDTSMLKHEAKDGERLILSASPPIGGIVTVSLAYESHELVQISPFQFTQNCTINNLTSGLLSFSQSVLLRKGESPSLIRGAPDLKVYASVVE